MIGGKKLGQSGVSIGGNNNINNLFKTSGVNGDGDGI